jgi:hypothetical protein
MTDIIKRIDEMLLMVHGPETAVTKLLRDCRQEIERLQVREGYVVVPPSLWRAVIEWAYCPKAGGYLEGPAMEDTCETLSAEVEKFTGIEADDEYRTVEELHAMIQAAEGKE